jgi:ArsR family transcriptional regulator
MDVLLQGLRAAAEPTRLRLLALCAHAELTVTELTQILGQSQPRVSRHLKLLCDAGLLHRYSEGTWAYYRLSDTGECAYLARTLVDLVPEDDEILALDLERLDGVKEARAAVAAEYFRANAERWDKIRSLYVPEEEVEAAILEVVGERHFDGFLDIGTGTGRILDLLANRINRGIGIDLSQEMLRIARANLENAGHRHCQVRHGDMYNLQLPGGEFELVVIHQVLHFAEDPKSVIEESARILKPGGLLVVVDFARHEQSFLQSEQQHRWLGFDEQEVADWLKSAGLEVGPAEHLIGDPLTVLVWAATEVSRGQRERAA